MNKKLLSATIGAVLAGGLASATTTGANTKSTKAALATADRTKIGSVEFKTDRGYTEVRVRLAAVPGVDALHGFHIHANDIVTETNGDGCIADPATEPATWFASADGTTTRPDKPTHTMSATCQSCTSIPTQASKPASASTR